MKIGWVALVKPSHPYLENGPAPLVDLHYLRISPWLWFRPKNATCKTGSQLPGNCGAATLPPLSIDLTIFINGLPIATMELKNRFTSSVPLLTRFEHEFDYDSPTELEHVAVFCELVQRLAPSHSWDGGRVVILARSHSLRACLLCRRPRPVEVGS